MSAEIVSLYETNFRDPVATLREIASEIESGKYGEVGTVAIVLPGDTMELFGAGVDSDGPAVGILLHAGLMRIAGTVESHGRGE